MLSPVQRAPAPSLPQEILIDILWGDYPSAYTSTLAYTPTRLSQDTIGGLVTAQAELARYTLVSRSWYETGVPFLYSTPVLAGWHHLRNFHQTISANTKVLSTTRTLIITDFLIEVRTVGATIPGHYVTDDDVETIEHMQEYWAVLESVLSLCTNALSSLQLWTNIPPLSPRLFNCPLLGSTVMSAGTNNLRRLSLRGTLLFAQNDEHALSTNWVFPFLDELSLRDTALPPGTVFPPHWFPSLKKIRLMHCYWAARTAIIPHSETGPNLTHIEFYYTMIEDQGIASTVRDHARTLTHLALVGKSELRAFGSLIATEASIGETQRSDPFVGPNYAARGPANFSSLRELTVSLIANPEARHFDFALHVWQVPPQLERLIIARRRWSKWRPSDFSVRDLNGIMHGLTTYISSHVEPNLQSIQVEGTFPPGAEEEINVLTRLGELCSNYNINYELTGRTVAEAISAYIADPSWEMNRLA